MALKKKSMYYVSNAELLEEVKLYKLTGVCSERLGSMLLLIARNYSSKEILRDILGDKTWFQMLFIPVSSI